MTCKDCDRPMIPHRQHRNGHRPEGTVRHGARGRCSNCHKKARASRVDEIFDQPDPMTVPFMPPGMDDADHTVRMHARDLADWLNDRRNRGIPPQGVGSRELVSS